MSKSILGVLIGAIIIVLYGATPAFAKGKKLAPVHSKNRVVLTKAHRPRHTAQKPTIYLTFDACSGALDRRILNVLVTHKIPATIFVTRRWLRRNSAGIKILRSHQNLFQIENHGARHIPAVTNKRRVFGIRTAGNLAAVHREVQGGADAIKKTFHKRAVWYRGATARYSKDAYREITRMGYRIAGFTLNADQGASLSKRTTRRRLQRARNGDIVIAHINHPERASGAGIAAGIIELKKRGYHFSRLGTSRHRKYAHK